MQTLQTLADATEKKFYLFKHSNSCPVSASANRQVEKAEGQLAIPVYRIVVQEQRELSDQIARKFGIKHETPQLILVRDGNAVWERTHWGILAEDIIGAAAK